MIIKRFLIVMVLVPTVVGVQILVESALQVTQFVLVLKQSTNVGVVRESLMRYNRLSLWLDLLVLAIYVAATPSKAELPEDTFKTRRISMRNWERSFRLEKDPEVAQAGKEFNEWQKREMQTEQRHELVPATPDETSIARPKSVFLNTPSSSRGAGHEEELAAATHHHDSNNHTATAAAESTGIVNATTHRISALFGHKEPEHPVDPDDVFVPEISHPPIAADDRRPSMLDRMTLGLMGMGLGSLSAIDEAELGDFEEGEEAEGEEVFGQDEILFDAVEVENGNADNQQERKMSYADMGDVSFMDESDEDEGSKGFQDITV